MGPDGSGRRAEQTPANNIKITAEEVRRGRQ
jgi:hypothetical protein